MMRAVRAVRAATMAGTMAAALILAMVPANGAAARRHAVPGGPVAPVDLGFPSGYLFSTATAINDRGEVVGIGSAGSYDLHGLRWSESAVTALPDGAPGPSRISNAGQVTGFRPHRGAPDTGFVFRPGGVLVDLDFRVEDQNERGQVVGTRTTFTAPPRAVSWWRGRTVDLGAPSGAASFAVAVSDSGQVAVRVDEGGRSRTARWTRGRWTDLPDLPGSVGSWAADINDRGDVVGWAQTADRTMHAVVWRGRRIIDLGALGGRGSLATAINDAGQVVGSTFDGNGGGRGFRWEDSRVTDLGILGGPSSTPAAISDRGDIVGVSSTPDGAEHGFRWSHGRMVLLGDFGGGTSRAVAVNNRGQAVGSARLPDGGTRAARWN
ncbi:hypothetical protein [Frankia sp. CcWB3]